MIGRVFFVDKDFASRLQVGDYLIIGNSQLLPKWFKAIDGDAIEDISGLVVKITYRIFTDKLELRSVFIEPPKN